MIPNQILQSLKSLLIKHEGYKNHIYTDSVGKITGGVGFNFSDRDLPAWFIDRQFLEDLEFHYTSLATNFSWFNDLNDVRKMVLVDMSFNLGFKNFCEFKEMIQALSLHNYMEAAAQMIQSEWAKEVGNRANELHDMMLSGMMN